jgi:tRNA/tmRNA/rRNA uracil-C5-methylase (TrmA/RlmC/RlmD family)
MGRTRRQLRHGTQRVIGRGRMEVLFPKKAGVDYSKLKMTPEGEYSITKRKDGEVLLAHMKSMIKGIKTKSITDLTGNVGGDTILFGIHFKDVKSIEMNPENFDALKNNVEVFGLKNVDVMQGDSTKVYVWKTDVLYLDPPWGGPEYKTKKELDLYLGDERVDLFLDRILKQDAKPDYIFMKLPANYYFDRLKDLPVTKLKKFKIRGFVVIGMSVI